MPSSPADNSNGPNSRPNLALDEYVEGVRSGDRTILGRAITLIESSHAQHQELAEQVLTRLMPETGESLRLGITGVPGVGKSTFIDTLGTNLTRAGHRVAVLAVDPSSGRTGGSILGDKTRMPRLGVDENAFIRPSPSAGTLGGVAGKTRETMLICEAAGFDVVLIETVGVGQSETVVADMTDVFLALMLAGAGDELQGIKRGLLEVADLIVVNKADGDNLAAAQAAAREYGNAMSFLQPHGPPAIPPSGPQTQVMTCSAVKNTGVEEVWAAIADRHEKMRESGMLDAKRQRQMLHWMQSLIEEQLHQRLNAHPAVREIRGQVEADVLAGRTPAPIGAQRILRAFTDGEGP